MIRAVLFDLYDTLVYVDREAYVSKIATCAKLVGASEEAFDRAWFGTSPESNLGRYLTIEERVNAVVRSLGCDRSEDIVSTVADIERRFLSRDIHVFPDAFDALLALRGSGAKLGIVTNASPSVEYIFKATSLRQSVDAVVISSEIKHAKPSREIYEQALERLEVAANSACFVGDGNDREIDGARAIGMLTILVRRKRPRHGVRESSREETADIIVSSLAEVARIVKHRDFSRPNG